MKKLLVITLLLGILIVLAGTFFSIYKKTASAKELVYLKVVDAVASSFDETPDWAPKPDPMAPVDTDLQTRWSCKLELDNEWIYFDFGREKTLNKIIIYWERAYAIDYELLVSNDLKKWKRLILMKDQDGGIDEINLPPTRGRYVKIIGLKRSNPKWGFSMWEFQSFGPKRANPQDEAIEKVFSSGKETVKERKYEAILVPKEPVFSPGAITKDEFQKGIVYTSWERNEFLNKDSDQTLQYLYKNNTRHLSVVVNWYQEFQDSVDIYPQEQAGGKTPTDEALAHVINLAHLLGMKVVLNPHLDVEDGTYRGDIIASKGWFASYRKFILHYAKLAAKYNVELLSVGTELANTTTKQWEPDWRQLIGEIRGIYKGPLVYAANWDEYYDVPFWDCLDFIGIDAYFPLTEKNDPDKEELLTAWENYADEIETWRKLKNFSQPVIFTEIGYDTVDGCNRQPWRLLPTLITFKEDQKEQSDCLDSALAVLTKRNWFKGLYYWNYFPRPEVGPLGYTLRGKLGEKTLGEWYGKMR